MLRDIRSLKHALRRTVEARRLEAAASILDAAETLSQNFLTNFNLPAGSVVAGYHHHRNEMDPSVLMQGLHKLGYHLALPVIVARRQPLLFRTYVPGDTLASGVMSYILEPMPNADIVHPDILLLPLLAFDRMGHRLGYGGGYYDRTVNELRQFKKLMAVGVAFACQEVPEVPTNHCDAKMDAIVTEAGILQF